MIRMDTWKKPRSHGDHFNKFELDYINESHKNRLPPMDVAKQLKCSVRTIQARYTNLNKNKPPSKRIAPIRTPVRKPLMDKPERTPVAIVRASRFYKSNFEPT